jgi:hypothetical protein
MKDSLRLEVEEKDGLLRITIPFGTREKIWMALAMTVMFIFGTMMSLVGEYAARSATSNRIFWVIPLFVLGIILVFYLLSLLAIRAMPGSIIEFDGKTLSIGSIGSQRRSTYPREKIKSLSVSRLPMVPVANLVILLKGDPSVRTGVCRQRDLEIAAGKLRQAIGLKTREAK